MATCSKIPQNASNARKLPQNVALQQPPVEYVEVRGSRFVWKFLRGCPENSVKNAILEAIRMLYIPFALDFFNKQARSLINPGRDSTLSTVYRQQKARNRILESYRRVKNGLKEMQDRYVVSKESNNFARRYISLKRMIKDVIILEKQYWTLISIPKQEGGNESQVDYVNRVLNYLDERIQDNPGESKSSKSGIGGLLGSTASLAEKAKDQNLMDSLRNKTTDELRRESERLTTDIFKLIKKYLGLRQLVAQLQTDYESSKGYPIIPRHTMLKDMVKSVIRAPAFSEICHEIEE